jgi:hypothetical protein
MNKLRNNLLFFLFVCVGCYFLRGHEMIMELAIVPVLVVFVLCTHHKDESS